MSNTANRILLADYLNGQQSGASFGRNYNPNPSAFENTNSVAAANSATVARNTTTPLTAISDFSITMPNNATGTVTWTLNTLDNAVKNQNCELRFDYTASSIGSNVVAQVLQGTSVAGTSAALSTSTTAKTTSVTVPCGDLSQATTLVIANGTGNSGTSAINIANVTYGKATNVTSVSQATFYGGVLWPAAASCDWTVTSNATFGSFTTNANCTLPTGANVRGNASDMTGATKIPSILMNNMPPGDYRVVATGQLLATSQQMSCRFTDGTNSSDVGGMGNTTINNYLPHFEGRFSYTTTANRTIEFQCTGKLASGTFTVQNSTSVTEGFSINVWRFPSSGEVAVRSDITPASWNGLHSTDCLWTTTSSTYADPSADTSCTLVERQNRNFGTVTSAGGANSLPGLTFTPPRVGRYMIIASVITKGSATGEGNSMKLTDGTNTFDTMSWTVAASGHYTTQILQSIFNVSSVASLTVKIQMSTDTGTFTIGSSGAPNASLDNGISWSIVELDAAMPTPIFVGSVTSSTTGQEHIERARIANSGSASITRQSGNWLSSVTRNSAGNVTLNFASGEWSQAPSCVCMADNTGSANVKTCQTFTAATTSATTISNVNVANTASDADFDIICMGAR